jgi:TPR repeat protein
MNETGMGTPVNLKSAQEYYQRAADKGEPISQLKLARLIISGKHLQMSSQANESADADMSNGATSTRLQGPKTLNLNVKSASGGQAAQS